MFKIDKCSKKYYRRYCNIGKREIKIILFLMRKNEISNVMLVNYESQDLSKKFNISFTKKKIHIIFNIVEPHLKKEEIDRLKNFFNPCCYSAWTMRILGIREEVT